MGRFILKIQSVRGRLLRTPTSKGGTLRSSMSPLKSPFLIRSPSCSYKRLQRLHPRVSISSACESSSVEDDVLR